MAEFYQRKKKVCQMCADKNKTVDFKNAQVIGKYVNEKGKILPRRMTGACALHQRYIAKQVKRARFIGIC